MPGTAATGTELAVAMGTKAHPPLELTDCDEDLAVGQEEENVEKEEVGGEE